MRVSVSRQKFEFPAIFKNLKFVTGNDFWDINIVFVFFTFFTFFTFFMFFTNRDNPMSRTRRYLLAGKIKNQQHDICHNAKLSYFGGKFLAGNSNLKFLTILCDPRNSYFIIQYILRIPIFCEKFL